MKDRIIAEARGLVRRLVNDGLFRDSSVLILATVLSGGLNYGYQIAMGRLLGPKQFGLFGSLFGLTYLLGILSAGVAYVTTRYVSRLDADQKGEFLGGFAVRVGILVVGLFVVISLLAPTVASFLDISDHTLIILVAASSFFGVVLSINSGAFRGLQEFVAMGSLNIVMAGLKLGLGVLLVLLGYGVYGALGALVGASAIALIGSTVYLREYYSHGTQFGGFDGVYRYAVPSILVAFCFNVPTNADVVLVKTFLTSAETGYYTAVATFGKVLVFLPGGITGALFPKVSESASGGDETKHLLRRALLFTGAVIGVGVALLITFPEFFISLMFGESYRSAADFLSLYVIAIGLFSLNLVFLNYAHARDDRAYVWVLTAITTGELLAMIFFSGTIQSVIWILILANTVGLLFGFLIYYR